MFHFKSVCLTAVFVVATAWAVPVPAAADPATTKIQSFYASLLDAMRQGPRLGVQGRYNKLAPVVDANFDLPAMTAFAVGPSWATTSPADQKALTDGFRRMTIASYASNFKSDDGVKFTVKPDVTAVGQDEMVQSELDPKSGAPIALNYRMRQADSTWKIIDVFSAGYVSELARRRSDFSSVLASGGVQALIKKMNDLADNMLKGP